MKFLEIKKKCEQKMKIGSNTECAYRRVIVSGLGGCLCRADNCFKLLKNNQKIHLAEKRK